MRKTFRTMSVCLKFGFCWCLGIVLPDFNSYDCSHLGQSLSWNIDSTSLCFGARAGALCNHEQSKTKLKRHLEHCLWYGSIGRAKFGHCLPLFCYYDCSLIMSKPLSTSGALEHELTLCEIMSNLKPSEKDIKNIVCDMAAQVDLQVHSKL